MLSPAQKRRHAELLAGRDNSDMAQAIAGLLRAEAELDDALADRPPETAADCHIIREYPILGPCTYEAGMLVAIEHPWQDTEIAKCRAAGIDVTWQWCNDPAAGLEQGELIRIWIGTRDAGPRLQWDRTSGAWTRLKSNGNYGRNWACGGTWRQEGSESYATLAAADPELGRLVAACA